MAIDTPSATQLSQVIFQVTAPSFLLGAVAAFVSVLIGRMNRTIDRLEALSAVSDDDTSKGHLRTDIPHLKRRAVLLNRAIVFATISAIVTSLLVIVAFIAHSFKFNMSMELRSFLSSPSAFLRCHWSIWCARLASHCMTLVALLHRAVRTNLPQTIRYR
jgi:hypothetical protein